jgi:hypothetical protein
MYLIWSSLESDASDLGYLFGNSHIESFPCVEALEPESDMTNRVHRHHTQYQLRCPLEPISLGGE